MEDILCYLSEREYSIILREIENIKRQQELKVKQETCNHTWRYDGHGHNDDCYLCTTCGKTDWR